MKALARNVFAAGLALSLAVSAGADSLESIRTYYGLCDASAAAAIDADFFMVADDEDNILRVYHRQQGVLPVFARDLSSFLQVDPEEPEADIEGAARLGEVVYWITSHGRNRKAKDRPSRQRFFAIAGSARNGVVELEPVGVPYTRLLQDLQSDPRLQRFNLAAAAKLAPKTPGALNIEGLAATPDGHLYLGFRSPVPEDRALIVPLLNPAEVITGVRARLGDPILLALDGRGIRSLTAWRGGYLLIAGSPDEGGRSELYRWNGGVDAPRRIQDTDLSGLNPEALTEFPSSGADSLLVVSDDGTLLVGKKPCKKLKQPNQRRFRAASIPIDTLSPGS